MKTTLVSALLALALVAGHPSYAAEDISLRPKYGMVEKTAQQKAADADFLANVDKQVSDRKVAAAQIAQAGWKFLRENNLPAAMRRFNQAWLLDNTNGIAIWGMAAIEGSNGKAPEALKLLAEAEPRLQGNTDFEVDYARTMSMMGLQGKDPALIANAKSRFEKIYQQHPEHTANLQNWAITLFYAGDYSGAWNKIRLAEKTPGASTLDQNFIAALNGKMARPK